MKKVKKTLISLAIVWFVSYVLFVLYIGFASPWSEDNRLFSNKDAYKQQAVLLASTGSTDLVLTNRQSDVNDLFIWPIFFACLFTIFTTLAFEIGREILRFGYRGGYPKQK